MDNYYNLNIKQNTAHVKQCMCVMCVQAVINVLIVTPRCLPTGQTHKLFSLVHDLRAIFARFRGQGLAL